ncbi:hypothetical protein EV1_008220 [Malus domestica]
MRSRVPVTLGAKKLQRDDVHSIGSEKKDESYTWSAVSKEAEALMRLNEKTSCSSSKSNYSKVNKSSKGKGEEENQLEIVPIEVNELGHGSIEQSMAELLYGLQDKTTMLRAISKMYRRKRCKRVQPAMKIVSSLGDRAIDSESSPEHLGPRSPSDSEAEDQIPKLDKAEVKRQTLRVLPWS